MVVIRHSTNITKVSFLKQSAKLVFSTAFMECIGVDYLQEFRFSTPKVGGQRGIFT